MLTIENIETFGWEPAIRGMRNPKNSWEKSDTIYPHDGEWELQIGENDMKLMTNLADAGQVHGKFLRMICVTLDITAPLYWWKEFDTYKVGTVANSCSTMHKIHSSDLTLDDFSHEHLSSGSMLALKELIDHINRERSFYLNGAKGVPGDDWEIPPKDKRFWWQMIQLLPSSYNQKRTVLLNYAVLKNIYQYRKDHKLDEWHTFCDMIRTLPYADELIIGKKGSA